MPLTDRLYSEHLVSVDVLHVLSRPPSVLRVDNHISKDELEEGAESRIGG